MKLITGIVTVALIAASVKVSSAGCGQCAADLKDAPHDHAESVEVDHQHADQITQCAIEMFSELGTDRVSLLAKADGGCATSATALMQDEIKSLFERILDKAGNGPGDAWRRRGVHQHLRGGVGTRRAAR